MIANVATTQNWPKTTKKTNPNPLGGIYIMQYLGTLENNYII
jgi:hypothetical protein